MLTPRLTNCPDCVDIYNLLAQIDCVIYNTSNNLYNNLVFMLNKKINDASIIDLIHYKRILTYKLCNPDYAGEISANQIASKVLALTMGCKTPCNNYTFCNS